MLLRPYRVAVLSLATLMAPAAAAQEPPRSLHGIQIEPFAQMAALDAHVRYVGGAVIERHYLPFQVVLLYVGPGDPDAAALAGGAARCRIVVHWLVASLDQAQAAQWWNEQFERTAADPQVLV